MRLASPLRYPGGKTALADLLARVRRINDLGDSVVVEPFAGGAGASLSLLFSEETPAIRLNDADDAVYSFWWSLLNRPKEFFALLVNSRSTISEWKRQRGIYRSGRRVSRVARGFAAFYLNRSNRSGIIVNGGPVGGIRQRGKWKLGARFNVKSLERRCRRIVEYGDRIAITSDDGISVVRQQADRSTFLFVDPPYYHKGRLLYLNTLDAEYHRRLSEVLRSKADLAWVVTYDDCPEIRALYEQWARVRPFSLSYAARERKTGREILIAPPWLSLPAEQSSRALSW